MSVVLPSSFRWSPTGNALYSFSLHIVTAHFPFHRWDGSTPPSSFTSALWRRVRPCERCYSPSPLSTAGLPGTHTGDSSRSMGVLPSSRITVHGSRATIVAGKPYLPLAHPTERRFQLSGASWVYNDGQDKKLGGHHGTDS